jgi:exonuclease SbcC
VQAELTELQARSTQLHLQIAELDQPLRILADLESQVEAQQQLQQTHQAAYQQYLRHRNEANTWQQLDQKRQGAIAERDHLQQQLTEVQAQWQQQSHHHNPQQLAEVTLAYQQVKSQRDQLQGGLPPKQQQLRSLEQQLQTRQHIAGQQDRDRMTLAKKQQVLQFVQDARRIYNQSGPQITKYYLNEISWEADNLFRELLNRMDVALEWTEDYDIRVQEQGHWRSFKSLSGGEQMCAALAVRLALLKVLADINVAFFDEPTTNMDQARRRQLAEALGHLKTFRQLFVISHDDTFESVTENIIRVEREAQQTSQGV